MQGQGGRREVFGGGLRIFSGRAISNSESIIAGVYNIVFKTLFKEICKIPYIQDLQLAAITWR